ncbi:MAG: bifunctional phosphopantothenoylcysteine decarboxylase/phosphopantothenate--cysteine ligase CoaBC [Deltaproteobacteria bacterium]|jgi:phosphopantothenoylcysteine decarboxylase/phosphopantothenate--cysteine ligase|nr:bifunctional phosphopantothenoylcysteine decarboxylase/phosphopantothenate--cysteine ligase CoaBC [Deltaproteobacteria bacterium]MCW8893586.1 bifunctional phosphopantothenoylcysteine decarboxylase/phosphopantothenate--cysteine ligase CoaBC [Deltaproteobacteria bacterium]MCW9048819.1 bifunctional phosphopantothenoylcysteine decarboxylase/phosphopantothenate--cysteine ligase CoaBC [Deltaproteobacteria bacterium]
MLQGKSIVLGVSGGIAVYKAVELLRLLTKAGADVHIIMTKNAQEFVAPLTFQTLSGNPVNTDLFNLYQEQEIGHIALADRADLFILVPATANLIGKIAQGLADDLLTTSVMATKSPVLIVPAMNTNMYENPIYQRNEKYLAEQGYHILEPVSGSLACGWNGKGKLPDPEVIFTAVESMLTPKDLLGCQILVTAGPTREEIDPVRYVSNYSSGKMGFAIAKVAQQRGAQVLLVSGPTCLTVPVGVHCIPVCSAEEMRAAVLEHYDNTDVVIKAAAVADYRSADRSVQKMKKTADRLSLNLERNPDILAELGQKKAGQILVGFAAETERLLAHAAEKLEKKNLDIIVANNVTDPGAGFDTDTNIVRLLHADGRVESLEKMSKQMVAQQLLNRVAMLWKVKGR